VGAWIAEAAEAIERVIKGAAKETATFSETRDAQAVLKLYAQDYLVVQDGEAETRDSFEECLADYESELKRGTRCA
jgi:ketosteroid isomerase-like protein